MKVWKFVLPDPETPVVMPVGAEVLHVGTQNDEDIVVWALVDPSARLEDRLFVVAGTGYDVPDERGRFLGTVLLYRGALVFHVWDRP